MFARDWVTLIKMKRISKWKIGVGAAVLVAVIATVGAKVVGSPMDSDHAYREKVAAEVGTTKMGDQADLDKKYTAEVNVRLVKLVGGVKAKGFSAKAGSTVDTLCTDNGKTPRPNGLLLKSNDGNVNLVVTTVPLFGGVGGYGRCEDQVDG